MYKVLVIPDIHAPNEDTRSLSALEKYMAEELWDEVIYLGDFMDFDCISHHNRDNLRAVSGKTIWKDYDHAVEILDRHQKLCPKAKFVLIEGNHDERIERYIDANPQLEGMVEVELGLELIKRKIKWVRFWTKGEIYRLGKASFIHGAYTNQYHAKKHLDNYDASVFYGHVHSVQSFSKVQRKGKPMIAQSLGCLCKLDQGYMRGRPSNWVHAFGVIHFRDGGEFNHYVVQMVDHQFTAPNGKTYKG